MSLEEQSFSMHRPVRVATPFVKLFWCIHLRSDFSCVRVDVSCSDMLPKVWHQRNILATQFNCKSENWLCKQMHAIACYKGLWPITTFENISLMLGILCKDYLHGSFFVLLRDTLPQCKLVLRHLFIVQKFHGTNGNMNNFNMDVFRQSREPNQYHYNLIAR